LYQKNRLMDIQTRKLNLIEYLIGLKDENIFRVIEDMISKSRKGEEQLSRPFTQQELLERAKNSNEDYLAGNFKDQEQLEIESKNW
jgi:hypothetical protein